MSRIRTKSKQKANTSICGERIACISDKEIPVVFCTDCNTFQCRPCNEELHKEGDYFYHTRTDLGNPRFKSNITSPSHASSKVTSHVDVKQKAQNTTKNISSRGIRIERGNQVEERSSDNVNAHLELRQSDSGPNHLEYPTPSEIFLNSPNTIECNSRPLVAGSTSLADEEAYYSDLSSGEFYSLGLDSILDTELGSLDMKGQPKNAKRNKKKSGSTSSGDTEVVGINHQTTHTIALDDNSGPPDFPPADEFSDEDIVNGLIQSQSGTASSTYNADEESNGSHNQQSKQRNDFQYAPKGCSTGQPSLSKPLPVASFLLIDELENIQVESGEAFIRKLNCGSDNVKVVSIFGNTGDGKSYTLNQVFFEGEEVFKTSADQETCTVGVWAAYDAKAKVICIDTEGLLGVSSNGNQRTRLLLKVLAVSDIIVYRTCADRLHNDLFQFLGDASVAYSEHFKVELESIKPKNGVRVRDLGPALIVFHETTRTNTLDSSATGKPADVLLQERASTLKCDLTSFSSVSYVGVQTSKPPTNFNTLIDKVQHRIRDVSVRSPRSPAIILEMLKVLNKKFIGEIYSHSPNSFPEEFFTCAAKCLACHGRCSSSMNHKDEHNHQGACQYKHVYDNKVYICKNCYLKGRKNVVVPKTCASDDNSLMGVAKYAWSGYILECNDCGVIYKSRQHWYGNREPTETEVQIEVKHIWPGQAAKPAGTHNAARKLLDGVKVVADTVGAYSSKPTKMLSDWVADQVAPPYWVPNIDILECHGCHREFGEQEKKHHCRGCGKGFCDECTQYSKPVPERGWGTTPVRVCESCYNLPDGAAVRGGTPEGDGNSLIPRQLVENVQTVLGAVAAVAIDYPIEMIKDSARPEYWVPDHLITNCHQCDDEFGPKLTIHHCRACGYGVCAHCSSNSRQVPSKGWDRDVRVCDTCYKKEGVL